MIRWIILLTIKFTHLEIVYVFLPHLKSQLTQDSQIPKLAFLTSLIEVDQYLFLKVDFTLEVEVQHFWVIEPKSLLVEERRQVLLSAIRLESAVHEVWSEVQQDLGVYSLISGNEVLVQHVEFLIRCALDQEINTKSCFVSRESSFLFDMEELRELEKTNSKFLFERFSYPSCYSAHDVIEQFLVFVKV